MSWDEILKGSKGDDIITGGSGDDYLQGRAGGDVLDGGAGNDQIHGDEGDDHLRGGQGDDHINGGLGFDTAYYTGSVFEYMYSGDGENFYISHTGGSGIDGNDWLQHVERLVFADAVIDLTQNNAPIAFDDVASTDEDVGTYSSGSASVLDNDFDWEGDTLSVAPGTFNGVYGTLVMNADGTYTYTPHGSTQSLAAGQIVQDSFSYTVSDGSLSDTGTLTFTIAGVNDAPVANPDTATGHENQVLTIDVLANDSDVDNGAVLTVTAASAPAGKGTASIVGNQVQFDPGTDFDHLAVGASEIVVVSYSIQDEHGASSSSTVSITVTGTNDGPVANPDSASGHENEVLLIDVLANDTDVDDGATLTVTSASAPAGQGSASVVGNQVQFDPGTDFDHLAVGASAFVVISYSISDEHGATASSTVTVEVTGTNDGPVANPDTASAGENQTILVDVLANDTDADDGAVLTVTAASAPAGQGTASVVGNQVEFDPGTDFDYLAVGESVDVAVSYSIEDEHGASSSSTVTVTVTGANDAPTIDAGGTTATGAVAELPDNDPGENSATHTAGGTIAFDDVDLSDTHSASFVAQGGGYLGNFSLDPVNQAGDSVGWDFSVSDADLDSLADGQIVTQTYTVTIDDGNGGTTTQDVTVTITGAADGPPAWYIDNSAVGSANLGTQADPYTSIAAFNAAQGTLGGPQAGDSVFILAGTGTGVYAEASGIVLLDGQTLTGVATGLVRPTIQPAAGPGVDLGENNVLSGFDVVTTSGTGILDDSAASGSLTMTDVNVTTTSGVAISLTAATGVSITGGIIASGSNYAISGVNVAGFALTDSTVTSAVGADAAIDFTGLTGTASLLGNLITGGDDTLRISNSSGALDLTIADSMANQAVFGHTNLNGNDSVLITTSGSASLTLTVDGVDFTGARGDLLQTVATGTSSHDLTIANNTFHNTHANTVSGGGGVTISGSGSNIAVDYVVENNSFRGADGSALAAVFTPSAGTIRGHIDGNVIGINDGIAGSEGSSGGGSGIFVLIEKAAGAGSLTHSLNVVNNEVYDIAFGAGIFLASSGGGAGNGALLEATLDGNTVAELGDFAISALYALVGGTAGSGDYAELGLDATNNTFDAGDADFGIAAVVFDQVSTDAHFNLPGYAGSPDGEAYAGNASTDLATFLAANGNVLTDVPFTIFGTGVYAELVTGVTGVPFVLADWP